MLDTLVGAWYHERQRCREWRGEPVAFLQPKHDGHRITYFGQENGDAYVFGKLVEADLEMSHQLEWTGWHARITSGLPPMSSIDGELHVPGKPASYVKTAILQHDPSLTFTPFAVPMWNGQTVATFQRAEGLCGALGLGFALTTPYMGEPSPTLLAVARAQRIEGWVLKRTHHHEWYKLKVTRTADLVVMGWNPGQGKYEGQVGSLMCSLADGTEVACVSGMTDEERELMTELGEAMRLRVVEVEYDRLDSGGRLRFPRFLRWRDDKRPEECTAEQLHE